MNPNEQGFLVFKCDHDNNSLPYRLYKEWSKWYGTDHAGYPILYFDNESKAIVNQLVSLGVLEIKRGLWLVTAFGKERCQFDFWEHSHTTYIYIPLETEDYLPF